MEAVTPQLAVVWPSIVAFFVLFVVLWKFALPPITGMLEKRSQTIRESLEKAEETKLEAERLLEEYKEQMAAARAEAGKVIEQGRKVAEAMKDEILAKANEQAAEVVAKAKEEIEAQRKAAVAELQQSVADLSVAVAGKLIGEELDAVAHARLIDRYLEEVGGLDATQRDR